MDIIKKISQQTFWQLLGKAVTSFSTFIILGMVTRTYGEAKTGIFTLVLAFLAFFYLAEDLGLNAHIIQEFKKENLTLKWQKLLGLRLILAGTLFLLANLTVIIWPVDPLFRQSVFFGSIAILGVSMANAVSAIFQYKLQYNLATLAFSSGVIVGLPVFYLVTQKHLGVPELMLGHALTWIVTGLLSFYLVRRYVFSLHPIFDLKFIKSIFTAIWPFSLTLILNVVYFRLDAFILAYFRTFAEVGIYNLSYQIFQSLLVVPTYIMNSFYPLMLHDYQKNQIKFKATLKKAVFFMFIVACLGTILSLILSPLVVSLITGGKGFFGSTSSLKILSLSFPAFFVSSLLMWTMITLRKYQLMLWIYLTGLIFNGLANLIFIPTYSYFAASWITVVSEYLILVLQFFLLRRLFFK